MGSGSCTAMGLNPDQGLCAGSITGLIGLSQRVTGATQTQDTQMVVGKRVMLSDLGWWRVWMENLQPDGRQLGDTGGGDYDEVQEAADGRASRCDNGCINIIAVAVVVVGGGGE